MLFIDVLENKTVGNLIYSFILISVVDFNTRSNFASKKRKVGTKTIFMNLSVDQKPPRFRRSELKQAPSIHQHRLFSLKRHKNLKTVWPLLTSTEVTLMSSIDTRCRSS